jgi:hypothetical protein
LGLRRAKPYIDEVVKGAENTLKGKPLYFAKTSGTTSGAKYIPLTKESMPYHIEAARNAIYIISMKLKSWICRRKNDFYKEAQAILEEKMG